MSDYLLLLLMANLCSGFSNSDLGIFKIAVKHFHFVHLEHTHLSSFSKNLKISVIGSKSLIISISLKRYYGPYCLPVTRIRS